MPEIHNFDACGVATGVLLKESEGIKCLVENFPADFEQVISCLMDLGGRIVVTGMGKSGYVARKVAATLASTGSPAFFLHPAEAAHGDLGMISSNDAILAFSNSGNTQELIVIIDYATKTSLPLIGITRNPESKLAHNSTYLLLLPNISEADPLNCVPTTSTTMQMALGDAIALTLMGVRGYTVGDFHRNHPGGALGMRLLLVEEIMHTGEEMPLIDANERMSQALLVMTGKGFGCTGCVENGKLVGIITDGDIRRHINADLMRKEVKCVMNPKPVTVSKGLLVSAALKIMHSKKISGLFVERDGYPIGYFNIHDCMRFGGM